MTRPAALAYSAFRHLPVFLRRLVVRTVAPSYVVGTVVVIQNSAGAVLLLRERHHDGWGLPGGLVNRGEQLVDGAIREVYEEIAVELDAADLGQPKVGTDPDSRRVDVIFTLTADGLNPRACEPEVLEARWFDLDDLPELFEPTVDVLRAAGVITLDAAK
jgi:ADP-ribose pyrophosphatase YjhB (NUDIX family)